MKQIVVRYSEKKDFEQLMEIDNVIWNEKNSPVPNMHWSSVEEYEKRLPAGSQLVAVSGDRVCGFVNQNPSTPLESNSHVLEMAIGIHPDFQGKGIGKYLIEGMEEWARKLGKKKLALRVFSTNESAIKFYRKHGYLEQGRLVKEFFVGNDYVDDLLMYKWLD